MSGYTKLFHSIVTSTIWSEDDRTRIVWVTMLAMANRHGEVEASIPGLAKLAGVPVDAAEIAIKKLASPDPYSRTKDHDGRRIEAIDGGWQILNHQKYREKASEEDRREQDRIRKQRLRASASVRTCPQVSASVPSESALSAQVDADPDPDAKIKEERGASAPSPLPREVEFWNSHAELPAVRSVSPSRLRKLQARRKDEFFAANWQAAIDRICQSAFCRGQNDRGWRADFDWFLQPDTAAKVLEGKYDDRPAAKPEPQRNCI